MNEKDISKTKTLTQKWRDGELESGYYYFKTVNGNKIAYLRKGLKHPYNGYGISLDDDIRVLALVPDYEEWEELQESNDGLSKLMFKSLMKRFVKADEERERLEEQLKDANEVIKYYANSFCGDKQEDGTYLIYTRENTLGCVEVVYNTNIANNYLEKWGVK